MNNDVANAKVNNLKDWKSSVVLIQTQACDTILPLPHVPLLRLLNGEQVRSTRDWEPWKSSSWRKQ